MKIDIPAELANLIQTAAIHQGLSVEEFVLINACDNALNVCLQRLDQLDAANLPTAETTQAIEEGLSYGVPCY